MTMLNGELIALLVHDLKNPLAALLSNLGFVASVVKDDEMTAEAVQDCLLSTDVLGRLIENIGVIGSLETRPSKGSGANVPDVLASVDGRMRRHAEASGFGLETRCEPGVGLVEGSSRLLELALDNILSTSLAYAPSNSKVRVVASREGDSVLIAVLDDGQPVSEEMKPLLLLKEQQLEIKSAKGARYGRALGLYVAALILRDAGGQLRIGASAGGGSVFELVLPVQR